MAVEELARLLNTLLEAERAGAKVLAAFLDDYARDAPAWRQLAAVQRDEATNCAILIERDPIASALHAITVLVSNQLVMELERYCTKVEIITERPLCRSRHRHTIFHARRN